MDEATLIDRIAAIARDRGIDESASVALGIGDDAAILTPPAGHELIASVDDQVEGIHFLRTVQTRWPDVGWKAAASALSDLAAMAARPLGALVAIAIPPGDSPETVLAIHAGLIDALAAARCPLAGGNLSRSRSGLHISITALGHAPAGAALRRSGARAGDVLLATGSPGAARAGMLLASADGVARRRRPRLAGAPRAAIATCVERFRRPVPRLDEALWIAEHGGPRAAIDLSDGLALDAARLAEASGVGLVLEGAALAELGGDAPLQAAASALSGETGAGLVLAGGEDYELLVALDPADAATLPGRAEAALGIPLRRVGRLEATSGTRIEEADGRTAALDPLAWSHDHLADAGGRVERAPPAGAPASRAARSRGGRRRRAAALALPWFFYGTLRAPSELRDGLTGGAIAARGEGQVAGRLEQTAEGYPALRDPRPGEDGAVPGTLVGIPRGRAAAAARRLDAYEDEPYRRVVRPIRRDDGAIQLASCYVVPEVKSETM